MHASRSGVGSCPVGHPVEILRQILSEEFSSDLPAGIHAVTEWCADPQFFPGATGLLSASSWSDVKPGSSGILQEPPPAPIGGVIALGNYQATISSYRRILSGEIGGLPTTWRNLSKLLEAVPPHEVFLTNAYIGFPDSRSDIEKFPTNPEYTRRCRRLLATTISLLQPRCVVAMGAPAARMLAATVPALTAWRPWPGLAKLSAAGTRMVPLCAMDGRTFTAVAVAHPSSRISNVQRTVESVLVQAASNPGPSSESR